MDSGGASDKSSRPHAANARQKSALTMFADTSARVVQTAAGILEEEIAAGIAAAKEISQGVQETVQGAPHLSKADYANLVERFRTDAHDVLEVLVTLFKAGTEAIAEVAKAAGSNRYTDRELSHMYPRPDGGGSKYSTRLESSNAEEASKRAQTGSDPFPNAGKKTAASKATPTMPWTATKSLVTAAVREAIEKEGSRRPQNPQRPLPSWKKVKANARGLKKVSGKREPTKKSKVSARRSTDEKGE